MIKKQKSQTQARKQSLAARLRLHQPTPIGALGLLFVMQSWAQAGDTREIRCFRGDRGPCLQSQIEDPVRYKQVILFPGGYSDDQREQFFADAQIYLDSVGQAPQPTFSSARAHQILYFQVWVPGGALGSSTSQFGAAVMKHPIRGKALTLELGQVIEEIENHSGQITPWSAMVIFNTMEDGITANAAPPSFLGKPYGVGKVTRLDLFNLYVPAHEMAHASLNFVDEYIEAGFGSISIKLLDILTPSATLHADWGNFWQSLQNFFGIYTYKISEILASNGNDNVDVSRVPSRVVTEGYSPRTYDLEGGMFFGKGTFHHRGKNLMGGFSGTTDPEDGFGYDHSLPQAEVIEQAFGDSPVASRPNDRLRAAGPYHGYAGVLGGSTKVVFYDADKNHHFHPTTEYTLQLGWYHRYWSTCGSVIKFPCLKNTWTTLERKIAPQKRTLELRTSSLYGLAGVLQKVLCGLGIGKPKEGGNSVDICSLTVDQMSSAFLPTLTFPLPYQEAVVPAPEAFTTYHWRFKTSNGGKDSGYTTWSRFTRTF